MKRKVSVPLNEPGGQAMKDFSCDQLGGAVDLSLVRVVLK